ncbi:hypothetical protein PG984_014997 [Apiospora sp. TS-2023a]
MYRDFPIDAPYAVANLKATLYIMADLMARANPTFTSRSCGIDEWERFAADGSLPRKKVRISERLKVWNTTVVVDDTTQIPSLFVGELLGHPSYLGDLT